MYVIVVGCGRVGSQLAELLAEEGHDVVVIDENENAFRRLGTTFNGLTIKGVGFDEDTLKEAGIEKADAIAAVTNFDNTNAMIVEVARKLFNVPHAIARLYNPERESTYKKLGIEYVCGTTIVAERMLDKIIGRGFELLSENDLKILKFKVSPELYGKKISEIEEKGKIKVVSVLREGNSLLELENLTLKERDEVIIAFKEEEIDKITQLAKRVGS